MVKAKTLNKKKLLIGVLATLLLLVVVLLVLEKKQIINLYSSKKPAQTEKAQTSSTAPTAQDNFTDGDDRQGTSTNPNEGVVSDNNGQVANIPQKNEWTSSSDGRITSYTPGKNGLVTKGSNLYGASSLQKVSFRLIDDVSGVIAQGTLNVVAGKFSGTFEFSTTATNGRLDLYYMNNDGVEASNVEIPVRFR